MILIRKSLPRPFLINTVTNGNSIAKMMSKTLLFSSFFLPSFLLLVSNPIIVTIPYLSRADILYYQS